jgi:hypothetical protein
LKKKTTADAPKNTAHKTTPAKNPSDGADFIFGGTA